MNQPTHDEIAIRAYQLWESRGGIHGIDTDTWLEAERELIARGQTSTENGASHTDRFRAEASTPTTIKAPATATIPDRETATAGAQKAAARAPQVPHHTGPTAKPAPPDKPVWDKPHSA